MKLLKKLKLTNFIKINKSYKIKAQLELLLILVRILNI